MIRARGVDRHEQHVEVGGHARGHRRELRIGIGRFGVGVAAEAVLIDAVVGDLGRARMHGRIAVVAVTAAEEARVAVAVPVERAA